MQYGASLGQQLQEAPAQPLSALQSTHLFISHRLPLGQSGSELHSLENLRDPSASRIAIETPVAQRHLDIGFDCEVGKQVVGLENEADLFVA